MNDCTHITGHKPRFDIQHRHTYDSNSFDQSTTVTAVRRPYFTKHYTPVTQTPYHKLVMAEASLVYSTLIITFHCNAPASRIAQARHPLFLRLMMAFQPF